MSHIDRHETLAHTTSTSEPSENIKSFENSEPRKPRKVFAKAGILS